MSLFPAQDLGSFTSVQHSTSSNNAGAPSVITAGGGLDNAELTGDPIDRLAYKNADSVVLATTYRTALAAAATLKLQIRIEESADGSSWDAPVTLLALTTIQAGGAGGNFKGVHKWPDVLRGRKRFVRYDTLVDLSAANTDTAEYTTVAVLGGGEVVPQG